MPNFENEVEEQLNQLSDVEIIENNTASYDDIDFVLMLNDNKVFVDAKEKKTRYRRGWVEYSNIEEENLFILDELGIKKLFPHFPYFFVVIKDCNFGKYFLYNAFDLLCMERVRLNRKIIRRVEQLKGKWLISYKWGKEYSSLFKLINALKDDLNLLPMRMKELPCYEVGKQPMRILDGKYSRFAKYWEKDISEK